MTSPSSPIVRVTGDLESGNVVVHDDGDPRAIRLGLRPDENAPDFRQWFHFRVDGARGRELGFQLDVEDATYADAFQGYDVCTSYDLERWFRTPTTLVDDVLRFELEPAHDRVYFAYFAPYGEARRHQVLQHAARSGLARVASLGRTVLDRSIHVVTVGEPDPVHWPDKRTIWVVARQHPGESMAEWLAEGLLGKLLDPKDPIAQMLREHTVIHVVANANPDGSALGNMRANAAGEDLNRAWLDPDEAHSPEVLAIRSAMLATGCDLFLDVHGDERNPFCFLAGCEGNPGYDERLSALEECFEQALVRDDDDFQDEYGYVRDEPGGGDLRTAGNWAGQTFECLSYTLEMPFKDAANRPDPESGWSPDRAKRLGAAVVEAIAEVVDVLR